jgi:hypothetical protein
VKVARESMRYSYSPRAADATPNVATRLQQPDPQNPQQFIPLARKIAIEIEYRRAGSDRLK